MGKAFSPAYIGRLDLPPACPGDCKVCYASGLITEFRESIVKFFYLLVGGLATFRLSLLITKEDGPGYIFRKLRKAPPENTSTKDGLSCQWCMSIWMSALVTTYYWLLKIIPGIEWPLYWLAMSAIGIICNQQWTPTKK
jgi:hypothetical protein